MKDQPTGARAHGGWRRVADALQEDIIFGRAYPRERLVEDDLMARFDCSRHAVRAAIDELVRLGLVAREPNRGAAVRSFSTKEASELFEVQAALEKHAVSRMPLPVSPQVIAKLVVIQKAHEAAGAQTLPLEIRRWNQAFHDTLFRACGNDQLADAIQQYSLLTDPIRMRRIPDPGWRKQAAADHREMIRMLSRGDRAGLERVCTRHIESTNRFFVESQPAAPTLQGQRP